MNASRLPSLDSLYAQSRAITAQIREAESRGDQAAVMEHMRRKRDLMRVVRYMECGT